MDMRGSLRDEGKGKKKGREGKGRARKEGRGEEKPLEINLWLQQCLAMHESAMHALKTHCVCSVVRADWTVTQKLQANSLTDLAIGRDDVHNTEQRHQRYADDPQQQLLPEVQRLHEAHLRPEPDAGEMLLAVGMRYELQHTRNTPVTVTATGHHQFLDNSNDH